MAENNESKQETSEVTEEIKMDTLSVEIPENLQEQVEKTERRTVKKLVEETIAGKFGSGRERMILLGDRYEAVQKEINLRYRKGEL